MFCKGFVTYVCVLVVGGISAQDFSGLSLLKRTLFECGKVNESFSCISDKVGRAVERSMNWDVPLIDGVKLVRNNEKINYRQGKALGFDRLKQALFNFFDTHVISLELGGARKLSRKGGHHDDGFIDKKQLKKEQKYMQYAFMVLLGIFGLTGPIVMKVIGLMAAKALLAAKAALIIVGSVALKKLFEKDHHNEPSVKVHTIEHDHEEEYDRMSKNGYFGYGHGSSNWGQAYNNPYSSYYDDYYTSLAGKSTARMR